MDDGSESKGPAVVDRIRGGKAAEGNSGSGGADGRNAQNVWDVQHNQGFGSIDPLLPVEPSYVEDERDQHYSPGYDMGANDANDGGTYE